jgi:hypothetical protein
MLPSRTESPDTPDLMHVLKPVGNVDDARAEFDRCWPWLWASLCEFGPTHNKEQVWFRLFTGKAFLWPGKRCVIVGEIIDWPIGLRDFNYWLQGGKLPELKTLHSGIEAWARTVKGCHRATGHGRDGWSRVMAGDWQVGTTSRIKWLAEPPLAVRQAGARWAPLISTEMLFDSPS